MTLTDFFERAVGVPGNGWLFTTPGRYAINATGQLTESAYSAIDPMLRPVAEAVANGYTEVELIYGAADSSHNALVRVLNGVANTSYGAVIYAGELFFSVLVAGVQVLQTSLAVVALTIGDAYRMSISVVQTDAVTTTYTITLKDSTGANVGAGTWNGTNTRAELQNVSGVSGYMLFNPRAGDAVNYIAWDNGVASTTTAGDSASLRAPEVAWFRSGGRSKTANPGNFIKARTTLVALGRVGFLLDGSAFAGVATTTGCPSVSLSVDGVRQFRTILPRGKSSIYVTTDEIAVGTHDIQLDFVSVELTGTNAAGERWGQSSPLQSVVDVVSFLCPTSATMGVAPSLDTVLVFGDSNTEGAEAIGAGNQYDDQDATVTFARKIATDLNMDAAIVGWSAQGYAVGGYGNVPTLPLAYGFYYYNQARNFASVKLALVNHGINGATSQAGVEAFCALLRSSVVSGTPLGIVTPWTAAARANITAAVNAVRNGGDNKTYLIDNGAWTVADFAGNRNPHLTDANHTTYKNLMLSYVSAILSPATTQPTPVYSFDLSLPDEYFDSPGGSVDRTIQCVLTNTGNQTGTVNISNIVRFPGNSNANVAKTGDWTLPAPGLSKSVSLVLSADTVPRTQSVVYFTATVNGYNVSKQVTLYNATGDGISPFSALPVGTGRTLSIPVRDRAWVCIAADLDNGARVFNSGDSPVLLNVAPYAPSTYATPNFTTGEILKPGETKVFSNVELGGDSLLFAICTRRMYPPIPWKPGTNYSELIVTRGE